MPVGLIALSMASGSMRNEEKWPPSPVRPSACVQYCPWANARAHVNRHRRRAIFQWAKAPRVCGWSNTGLRRARSNSPRGLVIVTSDDRRTAANVVRPLIYDTLNFKMPPRCRASSLNHYFMVTPEPPTLSGSGR